MKDWNARANDQIVSFSRKVKSILFVKKKKKKIADLCFQEYFIFIFDQSVAITNQKLNSGYYYYYYYNLKIIIIID